MEGKNEIQDNGKYVTKETSKVNGITCLQKCYGQESNNWALIDSGGYHNWRESSEPGQRMREVSLVNFGGFIVIKCFVST